MGLYFDLCHYNMISQIGAKFNALSQPLALQWCGYPMSVGCTPELPRRLGLAIDTSGATVTSNGDR
jgi:hypothetical protein